MTRNDAFDLTMTWEGGGQLHNIPGDPGGLTKYGFTQKYNPDVDVPGLTRMEAFDLYTRLYWFRMKAQHLPDELRWDVVDFAFNAGHSRAARTLQSAINLCQKAQPIFGVYDIAVDGGIGPLTLGALADLKPDRVRAVYRAMRTRFYLRRADEGKSKFLYGWLDRVNGRKGDV